jgi:HK97 gp10 family phage protein
MITMTPEQMAAKLKNISNDMLPAIKKGMRDACKNIEGRAKKNCTPGESPYSRAPHITGTLSRSMGSHVEVDGKKIKGIVSAGGEDSKEGPVEYASAVHEGTSRMAPRPFILDAIIANEKETVEFLSDAIEEAVEAHTI